MGNKVKIARSVSRNARKSVDQLKDRLEKDFNGYFSEEEREAISVHTLHCAVNGLDPQSDMPATADQREIAIDSIYLDAANLAVESNPELSKAIKLINSEKQRK